MDLLLIIGFAASFLAFPCDGDAADGNRVRSVDRDRHGRRCACRHPVLRRAERRKTHLFIALILGSAVGLKLIS